jgi:proteic killer suppression protein
VDLAFGDEKLRSICLKKARAVASVGPEIAHELVKRLADVRAAEVATDLLVGVSASTWNGSDVLVLSLKGGYALVLTANHLQNPTTACGKINWAEVTRVKVLDLSRAIVP